MFIANNIDWSDLNDSFIAAMLADLEDFDLDDVEIDASLHDHDVMYSMQ